MKEEIFEFHGYTFTVYIGINEKESLIEYGKRLERQLDEVYDALHGALVNIFDDYDNKLFKEKSISFEDYKVMVENIGEEASNKFNDLRATCAVDYENECALSELEKANKDFKNYSEQDK